MVFDTLLHILTYIPKEIIEHVPELHLDEIPIPDNFSSTLRAMVATSKHFFPVEMLSFIVNTMFALRVTRATYTIEHQAFKHFK